MSRSANKPRGRWRKGQSGNPGGKPQPVRPGATLAELIKSHVSPVKLLAALKSAAFKDHDRFALELLCRHMGTDPQTVVQPEPVPQALDLNKLDVSQLEQLAALMALAEKGDPEPLRKLEADQRESFRRMYPDNEALLQ